MLVSTRKNYYVNLNTLNLYNLEIIADGRMLMANFNNGKREELWNGEECVNVMNYIIESLINDAKIIYIEDYIRECMGLVNSNTKKQPYV